MITDDLKEFYAKNGVALWDDNAYFEQVVTNGCWYYDNKKDLWFNQEDEKHEKI